MTVEEKAALDLFLAFETQHHDHFTAQAYRLISKADSVNRRRMIRSFPLEVDMYEEWMQSDSPQAFYDKYDVRLNYKPEEYDKPKTPYIPDDDPIPSDLKEVMNDIAETLALVIGEHADNPSCFLLMIFDIGENGTMSYISNAHRDDVLKLMEEFIEKHQ
jgi:hypothetical protein